MKKLKKLERSIEVTGGQLAAVQMLAEAMIEGIRTENIDETEFVTLFEQGRDAFHNNKNMSNEAQGPARGLQ